MSSGTNRMIASYTTDISGMIEDFAADAGIDPETVKVSSGKVGEDGTLKVNIIGEREEE